MVHHASYLLLFTIFFLLLRSLSPNVIVMGIFCFKADIIHYMRIGAQAWTPLLFIDAAIQSCSKKNVCDASWNRYQWVFTNEDGEEKSFTQTHAHAHTHTRAQAELFHSIVFVPFIIVFKSFFDRINFPDLAVFRHDKKWMGICDRARGMTQSIKRGVWVFP